MYDAADVTYLYDGSMEGFLCCVYESVYSHTVPADILPEDTAQPTLFRQRSIGTDAERAERVWASIPRRISPEAAQLVWCVFFRRICLRNLFAFPIMMACWPLRSRPKILCCPF